MVIVSCMSVSRASLLLINSAARLQVNRGRGTPNPTTAVSRQLPFIEQKQTAPPAWFLLTIDGPADTVDEPPADSLWSPFGSTGSWRCREPFPHVSGRCVVDERGEEIGAAVVTSRVHLDLAAVDP